MDLRWRCAHPPRDTQRARGSARARGPRGRGSTRSRATRCGYTPPGAAARLIRGYARPIDVTYALLLALFTALLGFVGGIIANRALEGDRSRRDECRRLRDLAEELGSHTTEAASPDAFNFLALSRRRWDDAPQDVLRREEPKTYELCRATYGLIDELNEGSASVRRRGDAKQWDEGRAKADVRAVLGGTHDTLEAARAALTAYVSRRCGYMKPISSLRRSAASTPRVAPSGGGKSAPKGPGLP